MAMSDNSKEYKLCRQEQVKERERSTALQKKSAFILSHGDYKQERMPQMSKKVRKVLHVRSEEETDGEDGGELGTQEAVHAEEVLLAKVIQVQRTSPVKVRLAGSLLAARRRRLSWGLRVWHPFPLG